MKESLDSHRLVQPDLPQLRSESIRKLDDSRQTGQIYIHKRKEAQMKT